MVRAGKSEAASATCTKKTALNGLAAPPEAASRAPMATRSSATPSARSRSPTAAPRPSLRRRCMATLKISTNAITGSATS